MTEAFMQGGPKLMRESAVLGERAWDSLQFRLIFMISFGVHLFVATSKRLTPNHWRHVSPHRSIFAEAWEASGTTAEIACSG